MRNLLPEAPKDRESGIVIHNQVGHIMLHIKKFTLF